MSITSSLRRSAPAAFAGLLVALGSLTAADLNPAAIKIELPAQLKWTTSASGAHQAVLFGDPDKPGMYIILVKWDPGKMSHPHTHPHDRLVTVISGTWWVGTGTKFDPPSTKPVPPGSFVTHFAKQAHYDGAKDGEVILQIVGEGPETSTNVEVK
jgi:quercetin dioxygenase-like cupin family protein